MDNVPFPNGGNQEQIRNDGQPFEPQHLVRPAGLERQLSDSSDSLQNEVKKNYY